MSGVSKSLTRVFVGVTSFNDDAIACTLTSEKMYFLEHHGLFRLLNCFKTLLDNISMDYNLIQIRFIDNLSSGSQLFCVHVPQT